MLASSKSLRSLHVCLCYVFATMPFPSHKLLGRLARALTCTAHRTSTPKRALAKDCFIQLLSCKSRGMTPYNARMTKGPIYCCRYLVVCGELNKLSGPLAYYSQPCYFCVWLHVMPYTHILCIGYLFKNNCDFTIVHTILDVALMHGLLTVTSFASR